MDETPTNGSIHPITNKAVLDAIMGLQEAFVRQRDDIQQAEKEIKRLWIAVGGVSVAFACTLMYLIVQVW